MTYTPKEEVINSLLSEILSEVLAGKAKVVPEKKRKVHGKRRFFDIRIEYNGIECVLEASFDARDAVNDACRRIEEGLVETISLAVHYDQGYFTSVDTPSEIKEALRRKPLKIKVFVQGKDVSKDMLQSLQRKGENVRQITEDWIFVNVHEFDEFLNSVLEFTVKRDILSELFKAVEEKVDRFIDDAKSYLTWLKSGDKILSELYHLLFPLQRNIEKN